MAGTVNQLALALALAVAAFALGGCVDDPDPPKPAVQAAPGPDDDAYCQAKGFKPGSDPYVKCRKDRDLAASRRAEEKDKYDVRKMQDYMMDHH
jgi:hypothetical protein